MLWLECISNGYKLKDFEGSNECQETSKVNLMISSKTETLPVSEGHEEVLVNWNSQEKQKLIEPSQFLLYRNLHTF